MSSISSVSSGALALPAIRSANVGNANTQTSALAALDLLLQVVAQSNAAIPNDSVGGQLDKVV